VVEAVRRALAEDLEPLGDLTASLLDEGARGRLEIVAREAGVIAGQDLVVETFAQIDPAVEVEVLVGDGGPVLAGDVVTRIGGPLAPILTAERTALNFLGHLSGVASATARVVAAVAAVSSDTRILDTRKTTPGLRALEKAAVRAGGGCNHRANLSDAVLIKDNHLGSIGIAEAVRRARAAWPGRNVEVECEDLDQLREAAAAGAGSVLLDNMSPAEAAAATTLARELAPGMLIEVSGRITEESAAGFAAAGVDLISVGAITHSARTLDLGLDLAVDDGGRP